MDRRRRGRGVNSLDLGDESVAVLRDRLDARRAVEVTQGCPEDVNHLGDVAVLDDDIGPDRREDRLACHERAAMPDEMRQSPERLLRNDDAFASLTTLERALAHVETAAGELVNFGGSVRHSTGARKKNGRRKAFRRQDFWVWPKQNQRQGGEKPCRVTQESYESLRLPPSPP